MSSIFEKLLSRSYYICILFFCITILVYSPIFNGPFFFDDNIFIEHNSYVKSFDIQKIYTSSTTAGSGITGDNFYRPNAQTIYAFLFFTFGARPIMFHLVSIILHGLCGFLIFLLFSDLGIRGKYSLIAGLIFLLHPIQTQAVSYISGLSEPLMAAGILGALVIYIRGAVDKNGFGWKRTLSLLTLLVISLFSKENAVILSGLMLIIGMYLHKQKQLENTKSVIWIWTSVTAISLLLLSLRFTIFNFTANLTGGFAISIYNNIYTSSLLVRLMTFISNIYHYVQFSLLPIELHYETPYTAYDTLLSFAGIFGLSVIFVLGYLAFRSLRYGKGVIFFTYSWFFISILPVSGIIPTNAMYLEHWLYIPIVGLIFSLVYFLQENEEKNLYIYAVIVVLVIYSVMTFVRNTYWADPIKFYKNELIYTQKSARIYNNLAMEMANRGDCQDAVPYYLEAIQISDVYPQTHHNLGMCLEALGETKNAIVQYKKALEIDPSFYYSSNRLRALVQ